jgi:Lrp/AsnC family transcriptional regulator, leucine-responsive regulatory protein
MAKGALSQRCAGRYGAAEAAGKVYARWSDMSFLNMPHSGYQKKESFAKMAIMETLDKFDIAILNALQADGRLTNTDLAQRVGLSAAPCWRRVRALEEGGYITGYRAEINRHKIGLGVMAFVRLFAERNAATSIRELEQAIAALPQVVACHYISGDGSFELQVVEQDLGSFSRFAQERLITLPNVKDLRTSFSLGEVKASGRLPLDHLGPPAAATASTATPRMPRRR